jgi:uncharacterized protein YkwD
MRRRIGVVIGLAACALAAPGAAGAAPAWNCGASSGWLAAGGARVAAQPLAGSPCPVAKASAPPASGSAGTLAVSGGTLDVDGGAAAQTSDTRRPQARFSAGSLTISNADGSLVVTASKLRAQVNAWCDTSRRPAFAGTSTPGSVTLNGRPVDASAREYTEPGVGVNGAPLLGQIRIRFGEAVSTGAAAAPSQALVRRALHVIVTDRDGAVVFEAVGGEVWIGRDGSVCDPPPACPPGQQPEDGRCVDVSVTPLPPTLPPAPPVVPIQGGGHPRPSGCRDANARVGRVSPARLRAATLCLMNAERAKRKLRKLNASAVLGLAASRHARDMVRRHFFAHDAPGGLRFLDRVFRSGYLRTYGRWRVGENLGWGFGRGGTPGAMLAAWMRSAGHRHNVLSPSFRDAGVAIQRGSPRRRSPSGSVIYVIDFGAFASA